MTATSPQRAQEMLGDLAERAYALACRLSDEAMAAEDAEARGRLAGQFQQVARAVRQTLAWQSRLARDARHAYHEARAEAVQARRARVGAILTRVIHEESSGLVARDLRDDLALRLDEEALSDRFLEEPVEAHVARLSEILGLFPEPDGAPRPRRRRWAADDPRMARIQELLSRIPDETDDYDYDDDYEDDEPADEGRDDGGG